MLVKWRSLPTGSPIVVTWVALQSGLAVPPPWMRTINLGGTSSVQRCSKGPVAIGPERAKRFVGVLPSQGDTPRSAARRCNGRSDGSEEEVRTRQNGAMERATALLIAAVAPRAFVLV